MNTIPILLAEDDGNDVIFIRHAFREAGISNPLQLVETGTEAMEYLAGEGKFSDRAEFPLPCLMLMDINIPARTGVEVLQWMRERPELRHIIVIMWTASTHLGLIRQAYQLGVNSFLIKPENLVELTNLARLLKAYWLQVNQLSPECQGELREG